MGGQAAAWTGLELFVGGGTNCFGDTGSIESYLLDLETSRWRTTAAAPPPFWGSIRYGTSWTGRSVAVLTNTGAALLYNPTADRWHNSGSVVAGVDATETPMAATPTALVLSGMLADGQPHGATYLYPLAPGF
ncbi:MAG: hypothetical protein ACKV2O_00500 [Acidimicrobiales bacterium]